MIIIAVGGNLPNTRETLRQNLEAALGLFSSHGLDITARSSWYQTKAVAETVQPDFLNAVVRIETGLSAPEILAVLHQIEVIRGRVRGHRWEARPVDLDLIDYHGMIAQEGERPPDGALPAGVPADLWLPLSLPHPGVAARAFVLKPLAEIAPDWRHPVLGVGVFELLEGMGTGAGRGVRRLEA